MFPQEKMELDQIIDKAAVLYAKDNAGPEGGAILESAVFDARYYAFWAGVEWAQEQREKEE